MSSSCAIWFRTLKRASRSRASLYRAFSASSPRALKELCTWVRDCKLEPVRDRTYSFCNSCLASSIVSSAANLRASTPDPPSRRRAAKSMYFSRAVSECSMRIDTQLRRDSLNTVSIPAPVKTTAARKISCSAWVRRPREPSRCALKAGYVSSTWIHHRS